MNDVRSKLVDIFVSVFEVPESDVSSIEYQSVPAWDSIGHMLMISEIETIFSISIDMNDVIEISNFDQCVDKVNKYL